MEAKFKDIKAGDKVLVSRTVRKGWGHGRSFRVSGEVERVTATQFIVDGDRYRKDTGISVGAGNYSSAYIEDQPLNGYNREDVATDQSEEMAAYAKRLNLEGALRDFGETISRMPLDSGIEIPDLLEAHKAMCKFSDILAASK